MKLYAATLFACAVMAKEHMEQKEATMEEETIPGTHHEEEDQEQTGKMIDFTKLFEPGLCPEDVQGMEDLEYERLSGDWFLHRTDEPFMPELLPSCHHGQFDVNSEGDFTAKEEVRVQGKIFVTEDISGDFDDFIVEAEFFGDKLEVEMMILDTDYDNYMIAYQCYDNMQFTLDDPENVQPVHIITVGIATRDPNSDMETLSGYEDKSLEMLPFFSKEDFAVVKQGDEGQCDY